MNNQWTEYFDTHGFREFGTVDHATIAKNWFCSTKSFHKHLLSIGVPIPKHATVCDFTVLQY